VFGPIFDLGFVVHINLAAVGSGAFDKCSSHQTTPVGRYQLRGVVVF
jgi:hypothetical protein